MIFKALNHYNYKGKELLYEQVPDEDLWEDGEISNQKELMAKIEHHLLITGKWTLIRRISDDNEHRNS